VVANLPVGKNLQEHQCVSINFKVNDSFKHPSKSMFESPGLGPISFFVSNLAKAANQKNWPDLELILTETFFGTDKEYATENLPNQFHIVVHLGRPDFDKLSVGSIKLNTTAYRRGIRDNTKLAILDFNLLASSNNFAKMLEGRYLYKILKTKTRGGQDKCIF